MPAPKLAEPRIEITPKKDLLKILLIDDDELFLESTKELFENNNFTTVDTFLSPDKALEALKTNTYHLVIADVDFDDSEISGDRFVTDNLKLFKKAQVIVLTGVNINSIHLHKALEKLGIPILDKITSNWQQNISEILLEKKEECINDLEDKVSDFGELKLQSINYSEMETSIKTLFLDWLGNLPDPDRKVFIIGDDIYSAIEMSGQIESDTPIGEEVITMFVDVIRDCMKLGNGRI